MILTWDKPPGYGNCKYSYVLDTNQFIANVNEESYRILWEDEEIPVEISILQEDGGHGSPTNIIIKDPFPGVTNIKHKNLDDGQTRLSWTKPDSSSRIDCYVVSWRNISVCVTEVSFTDTFPKCIQNDVLVYVKYMGQSSANSSYSFSFNVGKLTTYNQGLICIITTDFNYRF